VAWLLHDPGVRAQLADLAVWLVQQPSTQTALVGLLRRTADDEAARNALAGLARRALDDLALRGAAVAWLFSVLGDESLRKQGGDYLWSAYKFSVTPKWGGDHAHKAKHKEADKKKPDQETSKPPADDPQVLHSIVANEAPPPGSLPPDGAAPAVPAEGAVPAESAAPDAEHTLQSVAAAIEAREMEAAAADGTAPERPDATGAEGQEVEAAAVEAADSCVTVPAPSVSGKDSIESPIAEALMPEAPETLGDYSAAHGKEAPPTDSTSIPPIPAGAAVYLHDEALPRVADINVRVHDETDVAQDTKILWTRKDGDSGSDSDNSVLWMGDNQVESGSSSLESTQGNSSYAAAFHLDMPRKDDSGSSSVADAAATFRKSLAAESGPSAEETLAQWFRRASHWGERTRHRVESLWDEAADSVASSLNDVSLDRPREHMHGPSATVDISPGSSSDASINNADAEFGVTIDPEETTVIEDDSLHLLPSVRTGSDRENDPTNRLM
jgi:hypothetical protein